MPRKRVAPEETNLPAAQLPEFRPLREGSAVGTWLDPVGPDGVGWKTTSRPVLAPRIAGKWNGADSKDWAKRLSFEHLTRKIPEGHWCLDWFRGRLPALIENRHLNLAQKEWAARKMLQIVARAGHVANLAARRTYLEVLL